MQYVRRITENLGIVLAAIGSGLLLWGAVSLIVEAPEDLSGLTYLLLALFVIIVLIQALVFATVTASIAKLRGRSFSLWFGLGFYLSFVALIVLWRSTRSVTNDR